MPEKPLWEGKNYSFFCNEKCEFFPCHPSPDRREFNCLFCYCPLYALGDKCGGKYAYTDAGIKDCSGCTLPHHRNSYGYITDMFSKIAEMAKKRDAE